jgi:hypothetical protein
MPNIFKVLTTIDTWLTSTAESICYFLRKIRDKKLVFSIFLSAKKIVKTGTLRYEQ